jgi:hypothetical protein
MTLAYHVCDYDSIYYKMTTIDVYNMQSKDIDVQCVMWEQLNKVMVKNGVPHPNCKGFMVNLITSRTWFL